MNDNKLEFDWNEEKAIINLQKHKISFEEAMSVWDDDFAALFHDPNHSDIEDRYLLLGYSEKNNLLIVSLLKKKIKLEL